MSEREIPGYEGLYSARSTGEILSVKTKKTLKPGKSKNGYVYVVLTKNKIQQTFTVHKLIAITFLKYPESPNMQIDHVDGNKINNNISNLEWVSCSENMKRTFKFERKQYKPMLGKTGNEHNKSKEVKQILNGNIINIYGSTLEAQRKTGINNANICYVCNGKRKTAGGFEWKR